MSGENYSIQELGGAELARHYPDRGLLPDSNWYNSVIHTKPKVEGLLSWLRSFEHCNGFMGILSARADGLRILVSTDQFAIFVPWTAATVSAERGWPVTVVRLRTAAVASLTLEFHLDDDAADDLFKGIIPALPHRDPPRRLAWWLADSWTVWIVLVAGVSAGVVAWLVSRGK
jgi:hypothetical protein